MGQEISDWLRPDPEEAIEPVAIPTRNYKPRGASKKLFSLRDPQIIISGPAETGKTLGCLQFLDALAWQYPGARLTIVRKVYKDMPGSVLETYERSVLGIQAGEDVSPDGVRKFGGERPEFYQYPDMDGKPGTRVRIAGMDNPGKVLSSERDLVYVNQTEELNVNDWETITTRTTGRAGGFPWGGMALGDANPDAEIHWINQRALEGSLLRLESRHEDNPTLYDEDGQITEQGKRSIAALDRLTGVRKLRLRFGIWAAAEGIVFEDSFDTARNLIELRELARSLIRPRRRVVGVDWGFTNPGVLQLWNVDGDRRMARMREIYQTKRTIDWWILQAKAMRDEFRRTDAPIECFVCDPARPDFIEQFRLAGLRVVEAYNSIEIGLQNVAARWLPDGNGEPRMVLTKGSTGFYQGGKWISARDEALRKLYKPTSYEEEVSCYVWPKDSAGRAVKEIPVDENNHANDAGRYAAAYVDGLGVEKKKPGVLAQAAARVKMPE